MLSDGRLGEVREEMSGDRLVTQASGPLSMLLSLSGACICRDLSLR